MLKPIRFCFILSWQVWHLRAVNFQKFGERGAHGYTVIPQVFKLSKTHGLFMSLAARQHNVAFSRKAERKADRFAAVWDAPKGLPFDSAL
jgi:Zn-dependent protease with chaperone function